MIPCYFLSLHIMAAVAKPQIQSYDLKDHVNIRILRSDRSRHPSQWDPSLYEVFSETSYLQPGQWLKNPATLFNPK